MIQQLIVAVLHIRSRIVELYEEATRSEIIILLELIFWHWNGKITALDELIVTKNGPVSNTHNW